MKKFFFCTLIFLMTAWGCTCPCECGNSPKDDVAIANAQTDAQTNALGDKKVSAQATPIEVGAAEIVLPKPVFSAVTLEESLRNRHSTRAYSDKILSLEQLSALLWATYGVNREDGKRTAPSARNKQSVEIYAAFEKGVYRYDAVGHKLVLIDAIDVRPVKLAPLELIFSSNVENELIRGIDAGTASQNAALYCASEGLETVIRMMRGDLSELSKALKIEENRVLLFNMAIGFAQTAK